MLGASGKKHSQHLRQLPGNALVSVTIGPPQYVPSFLCIRYCTERKLSENFKASPTTAASIIHPSAPGPPSAIAEATPTILPVPISAASSVKPNVISAGNAVTLSKLQLKVLMGITEDFDLKIADNLANYETDLFANQLNELNEGLVNNTTMKQFDLNMKMLNQSLKSLKTNFMPTLGMNYSYQYQSLYNNNWNVFDYNWGGSSALVFTLNIPLYKASNFTKLKTARIQINQLKENRTDTERKLNMQITSYQNNMAASSEQVVSNKENVMQAQKAVEIAGKRYEVGKGTVLELNSSQVSLTQAELTYNQSIYDYLVSKADLDQVLGRDYSTNK